MRHSRGHQHWVTNPACPHLTVLPILRSPSVVTQEREAALQAKDQEWKDRGIGGSADPPFPSFSTGGTQD